MHSYESILPLDKAAQQELLWWRDHLPAWNSRSHLRRKEDRVTETDALNLGWGASYSGIRTGGIWPHPERLYHINCLELMLGEGRGLQQNPFAKTKLQSK